ncbi:abscisic acid ABA receptor [Colletotrichum lupini]|uniref:Abscisic acid ABA receptor n=1 Tax=Colletotrichum lupini TaxID=145971 RepID=A0A9Q8T6L5_9PEZI|nr:abscisic acid ABA receptor [Colletotrichum lupini]UQC89096.1 abscisic acid ABA receptor [Colletotrichum lupini]
MDDPSTQTTKILTHLSKTLSLSPPQSTHPPATLTGLPTSHTGTAYLFLSVSAHHPRLQIHSYPAIHWARAYISNIPTPSAPISLPSSTQETARDTPVLGLLSDDLAGPAIRACVTKDLLHVRKFLAILSPVLEYIVSSNANANSSSASAPAINSSTAMDLDAPEPTTTTTPPLPSCLLHGLAGTLYLLRLIRHWVPSSAPLVCGAIVHVSEYLLGPHPWTCPSRLPSSSQPPHSSPPPPPEDTYGTTHGDLGIITQLVLTSPPLAASPSLTSRLAALLDLQSPNGDRPGPSPTSPSQPPRSDAQQSSDAPPTPAQQEPSETAAAAASQPRSRGFASGPQGLVISLLSLRPFFPSLHDRIDAAVDEAREFLWARAVDPEGPTEEVNLFYGSLSTALTFPKGPKRTHLLTQQPPSPNQPLSPPTNTNTTTTPQNPSTPSPPSSSTPTTPPTAGSVTTAPHPGSAYLHAVAARDMPRMIFYNDT